MNRAIFRLIVALLVALVSALTPFAAGAQSTHGLHSQQILPVVVDTASYSSRITITSPMLPSQTAAPTVDAYYVPADGTATTSPMQCNPTLLEHGKTYTYGTLRALCPNLAQGSNYGYLRLVRRGTQSAPGAFSVNRGFHAYSRVSSSAGIGFSVEGFPENAFSGATQVVLGARNAPATASTPSYQTNCFVGTFSDFPQGGTINVRTTRNLSWAEPSTTLTLGPNRLVRILDVFAATGSQSPAFDNASVVFSHASSQNATKPFMAFCTVQDNASFGADFRIAEPLGYPMSEHSARRTFWDRDALGRGFSLAPGGHQAFFLNFHVPDIIGCDLVNPTTQAILPANNGIELYLRRANSTPIGIAIAGGPGVTSISNVDLGSKEASGYYNPGHLLVVQSTATPAATNLNYGLVCRSGSGHSLPHRIAEGDGRLIP